MISKKYIHKIIGIPVVVTSLGVTIWLVNKWKLERLLNADLSKMPPTPDEPSAPQPNVEPSEDEMPKTGTSTNEAQNVSQGDSDQNRGESGKAQTSEKNSEESEEEKSKKSNEQIESKDEQSSNPDDQKSNEEDSRAESVTQENTDADQTSKNSDGSSKSEDIKVELTEEIKKLIHKLSQEAPRWKLDITSLRNTFAAHELLSVGNKLLEAWEKKIAADKASKQVT